MRGFERPRVQWMVIALCAVLTIMLAAATVRMWTLQDLLRKADQVMGLNEKERQTLERDLARERSAREALSLELGRARSGAAPPSTLTLDPLIKRSGSPPESNMEAPRADGVIELRLLLPDTAPPNLKQLQITARDWSTGTVRWSVGSARLTPVDGRRAAVAYVTGEMIAAGTYEFLLTPMGEGGPQPDAVAAYELGISRRATR